MTRTDPIGLVYREPRGIPIDAWLSVLASHPSLRQMAPVIGINPFTRAPMSFSRAYAAHVCVSGKDVGTVVWEANHLHVFGAEEVVAPIARAIAETLEAKFALASEWPAVVDDQ